jgi:hypothetical protein
LRSSNHELVALHCLHVVSLQYRLTSFTKQYRAVSFFMLFVFNLLSSSSSVGTAVAQAHHQISLQQRLHARRLNQSSVSHSLNNALPLHRP